MITFFITISFLVHVVFGGSARIAINMSNDGRSYFSVINSYTAYNLAYSIYSIIC